jgi:hypothetical protein
MSLFWFSMFVLAIPFAIIEKILPKSNKPYGGL